MDIEKLFRENLKNFTAYEPGEQPVGEGWIKLNTNCLLYTSPSPRDRS